MKLRFHSATLRLRLSRSEVALLRESGRVEEQITFAGGHGLSYAIELRPAPEMAASFDGGRIEVAVPEELGRRWIDGNEAGIENPGATPKILIEKDFQCVHGDAAEQADAFPNPLMDKF